MGSDFDNNDVVSTAYLVGFSKEYMQAVKQIFGCD